MAKLNVFQLLSPGKGDTTPEVLKNVTRYLSPKVSKSKGGKLTARESLTRRLVSLVTKDLPDWIPGDITSFSEYDSWQESRDTAQSLMDDTTVFTALAGNIVNSDLADKPGALKALAGELTKRLGG